VATSDPIRTGGQYHEQQTAGRDHTSVGAEASQQHIKHDRPRQSMLYICGLIDRDSAPLKCSCLLS
jgi:hypothetical protein